MAEIMPKPNLNIAVTQCHWVTFWVTSAIPIGLLLCSFCFLERFFDRDTIGDIWCWGSFQALDWPVQLHFDGILVEMNENIKSIHFSGNY